MSVDDLWDALAGIPRLPGAACRGRAEMFDQFVDPEVVEYCLLRCESCGAKPECERWYLGLPQSQRPHGVVAGRVHKPRAHHHKNRKPKNTA